MSQIITLRRIRGWKPCEDGYRATQRLYPDGVPLTREAAHHLLSEGVDVVWGLVRLLTPTQRQAFIVWTLRQRQPHVVALLRRADLNDHADAVAGLVFDTLEDAETATVVFDAARDAAWDARDAAGDAAWDARAAAWAAARDARDAAWAAARDARDAAWAAARDARDAGDAAWDAARAQQVEYILDLLEVER